VDDNCIIELALVFNKDEAGLILLLLGELDIENFDDAKVATVVDAVVTSVF
jgi:hypothetical protein